MSSIATEQRAEELLEDLDFLDSTHVGATEAASRTGFPNAHAMEKWLERHGRHDLWLSLKRRDPAGTHLSGQDRRRKRIMSVTTDTTDTIADLLNQCASSTRARTRKRAERITELVDELRETFRAEREDDERREEARKEIERLEQELAEAKARLRGGSGPVTIHVQGSVSAAELRAWARNNGVECPPVGRVPVAVQEAYSAAHEQES